MEPIIVECITGVVTLVVAFVMAVLSPVMAALSGGEEIVIPKGGGNGA